MPIISLIVAYFEASYPHQGFVIRHRTNLPNLHGTLDHDGNADNRGLGEPNGPLKKVPGNFGGNAAHVKTECHKSTSPSVNIDFCFFVLESVT